jgi:hypothetical protein
VLPTRFGDVEWLAYADRLDCRDPDDVVAYLASTPPVETATDDQHRQVVAAVAARFAAGGGRLRVSKDTGVFLCRTPQPPGRGGGGAPADAASV